MESVIAIKELPENFVFVLRGLFNYFGVDLPSEVVVEDLPIADYFSDMDERIRKSTWTSDDDHRSQLLETAMRNGVAFPPLVVESVGGLFCDGYHRLKALRSIGVESFQFIVISKQRPSQRCAE